MPYDLSPLVWTCDCNLQPSKITTILGTLQGYLNYLDTLKRPFVAYVKPTEPNVGEWATIWDSVYGTTTIPLYANLIWMTDEGFGGYFINTPNGIVLIDSPYSTGRIQMIPIKFGAALYPGDGVGLVDSLFSSVTFNLPRPAKLNLHLQLGEILATDVVISSPMLQTVRVRLEDAVPVNRGFVDTAVDQMNIELSLATFFGKGHQILMSTQNTIAAGTWLLKVHIPANGAIHPNSFRWGDVQLSTGAYNSTSAQYNSIKATSLEVIYA